MMAKLGSLPEARKYLADLPAVTIEQRVQVRQAEAQLLRDAGDNAGAYAVLTKALAEHPGFARPALRHARWSPKSSTSIDDAGGAICKRLVELKPDNAQALNALGYTLVDRTPRIDRRLRADREGLEARARRSVHPRQHGLGAVPAGQARRRNRYLRRAIAERPDAEIAAHLGEVLWAKGERDRAREIWQSQLKTSPDNPVLQETVRRLEP